MSSGWNPNFCLLVTSLTGQWDSAWSNGGLKIPKLPSSCSHIGPPLGCVCVYRKIWEDMRSEHACIVPEMRLSHWQLKPTEFTPTHSHAIILYAYVWSCVNITRSHTYIHCFSVHVNLRIYAYFPDATPSRIPTGPLRVWPNSSSHVATSTADRRTRRAAKIPRLFDQLF